MTLIDNLKNSLKIASGVTLLALSACSSGAKKDAQITSDTAIVVTVSTPAGEQQQGLNVSGQIEAAQSANISTRVMGYITKLNVKVGDHVSAGQVLATISNDDILAKRAQADAMITEADAGLKNAQKDYDRFNNLYKQQSASAKELDNVSQQYTSAKARLEAAKQMRNEVNATLNYTRLTAPFSGVVTQKLADAGSMANPGMPILTIEQSGSYQVSASVPESYIDQVKQGSSVVVAIDAIHKTLTGSVSQISQSSQFTGGQYTVKISIPGNQQQGLFAGMYANVSIPVKQNIKVNATDSRILVPASCIEHKDDLTGLYTVGDNHTALLRWVRLGKVEGNKVEVLSGRAPNEQFIASAEGRLFNGAAIKIK
jgi:RND family efflux transporter MFP subunit